MAAGVWIIILNWNGKKDTLECLGSVYKTDYPDYQVMVVDNGSTDGSVEAIKSKFAQTMIIENKENLGFAAGNNRGITYALSQGADYIMLLNNDAAISGEAVRLLVQRLAQDKNIGVIGPLILYWGTQDRVWSSGGRIDWFRGLWGRIDSAGEKTDAEYDVDALSGCAMMFNARAFKECGLFDEKFFLYGEDTDLCLSMPC